MRKITLAVLVAGMPLAAQSWELGLFAGQQSYKSVEATGISMGAKNQTVLGARVGYSVVDLGPALFQITAGFQPKTETGIDISKGSTSEKYQQQHMSLGVMFNFKAVVAVGAGIEYRQEKLNITNSGFGDTTYNRPWLRANLGYAIPSPIVKPFFGLEVAVPLTSTSVDTNTENADNLLRSMAPKLQVGLYAGIRF